jgi:hypothetical protein
MKNIDPTKVALWTLIAGIDVAFWVLLIGAFR